LEFWTRTSRCGPAPWIGTAQGTAKWIGVPGIRHISIPALWPSRSRKREGGREEGGRDRGGKREWEEEEKEKEVEEEDRPFDLLELGGGRRRRRRKINPLVFY